MPNAPLPDASVWQQFPAVAVILLFSIILIGVFVFYSDRRDKVANAAIEKRDALLKDRDDKFLKALTDRDTQWQGFLTEQRKVDNSILSRLVDEVRHLTDEIIKLRSDFNAHDKMERQVITMMNDDHSLAYPDGEKPSHRIRDGE